MGVGGGWGEGGVVPSCPTIPPSPPQPRRGHRSQGLREERAEGGDEGGQTLGMGRIGLSQDGVARVCVFVCVCTTT